VVDVMRAKEHDDAVPIPPERALDNALDRVWPLIQQLTGPRTDAPKNKVVSDDDLLLGRIVERFCQGLDTRRSTQWFDILMFSVGPDHAAPLCDLCWRAGRMSLATLRSVILNVWAAHESAEARLGRRRWLGLFTASGFVADPAREAPGAPIEVWRGASPRRMRGMAWTTELSIAEDFASRTNWLGGDAVVFHATIPADAVLAMLDRPDGLHGETVIVRPDALRGRASPSAGQ
jgi:hypothetical protein